MLKVCTVCNGGLFTSLMLEESAKKAFKKFNIDAIVEHNSANTFSAESYDVVIADRALASGMTIDEKKLIVINVVTDDDEIETKIEKMLKEKNLL